MLMQTGPDAGLIGERAGERSGTAADPGPAIATVGARDGSGGQSIFDPNGIGAGAAIADGNADDSGDALVTGAVSGDSGQLMEAVSAKCSVPGVSIGRLRIGGAEVLSIEFELDAGDADVVAGSGRDVDCAGN